MLIKPDCTNMNDEDGNPTGGSVRGVGLTIDWQDGPLGRGAERLEPNGAFVENVIYAARQRLACYQASKFKCNENEIALQRLDAALEVLNGRTRRREAQDVEGTYKGS